MFLVSHVILCFYSPAADSECLLTSGNKGLLLKCSLASDFKSRSESEDQRNVCKTETFGTLCAQILRLGATAFISWGIMVAILINNN